MNRWLSTGAIALTIAGSACADPSEPVVCTDIAVPAMVVEVRDSVTNDAPAGAGRIIATTTGFADTILTTGDWPKYGLAHERAGTYTLTAEISGYRAWTRSGIVVSRDRCHVHTVQVIARLQH